MANEKTVISIEVEGTGKAINSIKELKAELKAAQSAALNGDGKAAKRVAELKDKMDDLKDTTKSLQGSGVEKISSSFSLLGEGFKDFDTDKIKTGFKGIGSAMSAIPIFLIIEGLKLLWENFDVVAEFAKKFFTIASDGEKKIKSLSNELEKQKETTAALSREINRELELMEAQGVSSDKLLAKKKELIQQQIQEAISTAKLNIAKVQEVNNNDSITESIIRKNAEVLRTLGFDSKAAELEKTLLIQKYERNKDNIKAAKDSFELIKDLQNKELVETVKVNKQLQGESKKHLEEKENLENEKQKRADAIDRGNKKLEENSRETDKKYQAEEDAEAAALDERNKKALDEKHKRQIEQDNQDVKDFQDKEAAKAKAAKDRIDGGFALAKTSLESTQALSDIFFANKLSKVKKGSAEETAIAKKQFEVNKALQIAQAVMQGAQAVLAAYASGSAIPIVGAVAGPLYAVAAGLVAIKNIQTIKNAQFGGGASSAPDTSAGNVSIPSNGTPNIAPPTSQQPSTTFTGNKNDQFQPVKAFVTETDIRHSSKRIDTLQSQATY